MSSLIGTREEATGLPTVYLSSKEGYLYHNSGGGKEIAANIGGVLHSCQFVTDKGNDKFTPPIKPHYAIVFKFAQFETPDVAEAQFKLDLGSRYFENIVNSMLSIEPSKLASGVPLYLEAYKKGEYTRLAVKQSPGYDGSRYDWKIDYNSEEYPKPSEDPKDFTKKDYRMVRAAWRDLFITKIAKHLYDGDLQGSIEDSIPRHPDLLKSILADVELLRGRDIALIEQNAVSVLREIRSRLASVADRTEAIVRFNAIYKDAGGTGGWALDGEEKSNTPLTVVPQPEKQKAADKKEATAEQKAAGDDLPF